MCHIFCEGILQYVLSLACVRPYIFRCVLWGAKNRLSAPYNPSKRKTILWDTSHSVVKYKSDEILFEMIGACKIICVLARTNYSLYFSGS